MLKNYFKVALRNLWKNKGYTSINIIGLAAGLGVCLLIVLYVMDELSYDRYNTNADRIYRVDADIFFNNTLFDAAVAPKPLAITMKREYPEIEQMVRINRQGDVMVKKDNNFIQDHHLVFADSTFFQVFTATMVAGNPATALNEPHSLVIDESVAKRYFNSTNVVGRTLELENKQICKVTGVIKDMPSQSHFHFSFIRPLRDGWQGDINDWLSNNYSSYILVKPGIPRAVVQAHLNAMVNNYLGKQLQDLLHSSLKDMEQAGGRFQYKLIPLTDIHLRSGKSAELEPNGNINYVYTFPLSLCSL